MLLIDISLRDVVIFDISFKTLFIRHNVICIEVK